MPVVKILARLELEPRLNIKTDLTGQAKLNIFQRSQYKDVELVSQEKKWGQSLRLSNWINSILTFE